MNQDMLTISTKFLRIMEMASVELGGFEVRSENESVYVTDNFFSMLGKGTVGKINDRKRFYGIF